MFSNFAKNSVECDMNNRQLFLQHVAQTSDAPLALEIVKAEGMYMWDAAGKRYLDLIAGISVCNVGHCHPAVVKAIQEQAQQYMHLPSLYHRHRWPLPACSPSICPHS